MMYQNEIWAVGKYLTQLVWSELWMPSLCMLGTPYGQGSMTPIAGMEVQVLNM